MPTNVTLTILGGSMDGTEFTFDEPARCVIGRSEDCSVRLPNKGWQSMMVSRHHCLLDIDPPQIRVRDLGSRNGTYINGRLIGLRADDESPTSAADTIFASHDLKNGDVLSVGPVTFRVQVMCMEPADAKAAEAPAKPEAGEESPADWLMLAI